MSRYRYDPVKDRMTVLDEKNGAWKPVRKSKRDKVAAPYAFSDIREFVSVATHAPVLISSRSKLAAYERANNIRQCGDHKPGDIIGRRKSKVETELAHAKRVGGDLHATWSDFRQ
jgi:hypothetical protein